VKRVLPIVFILLLCGFARAGVIDITSRSWAVVHNGHTVTAYFGVWNYGANNPDVSPYPTTVGLLAIGQLSAGQTVATVPGSTQQYLPGYVFEAYLESLDGSFSTPLFNAAANALGLGTGYAVVTVGTVSIGGELREVGTLSGSFQMSEAQSEALFGTAIGNFNDAARIRLVNRGEDFLLGMGDPYTVGSSISEPGIRGAGAVQTAGIPGTVTINNPEPGTWALMAMPLAVFSLRAGVIRWRRRAPRS